jgi:fibronectin type 3 domain-containing protein
MRSPLPVLVAALGGLAVGGILFVSLDRSGSEKDRAIVTLPAEDPAPKDARRLPDALTRLLPESAAAPVREFAHLFESRVGESIVLPFGAGLSGRVNLVHRHPSGDLALGIDLEGAEDATAFLSLSPEGRIDGQISSGRSGWAWRLATRLDDGTVSSTRIRAEDLVCARFEEGGLQPGLPPEPLGSEVDWGGMSGPEEIVPALQSRPGASRHIYLNFEGETVTGTPWNSSYNNGLPIVAAPFGTPAHIEGIWKSIAEDYAVFDVNITTVRADFDTAATANRVMVIFTPTKAWYGSAGGVAYVDSFGSPTNPYCWVFNLTLNGAAESGGHEIGHTVGLRHDGTSSRAYYTGHTHASGVSWGAIMGTSYGRTISQFSKGEYPGANRTEDDLAIVSSRLPYLPDDHGDSIGQAREVSPTGTIDETGLISSGNDADLFRFESTGPGPLSVTATPHPAYRNLDVGLELLDDQLDVIASAAPAGPFDATITTSVTAGVHYLRITGTGLGDLVTGYGKYGSIGSYTLTGTYPGDPLPASPTGLTASDGTSTAAVLLAWDAVPSVDGYRVYRGLESDGSDAVLLASPTATTHDDDTAVAGTVYCYFVRARSGLLESPLSTGDSGWRQRLPPDPPASVTATDDSPHSIRVSWLAAGGAQSYRISRNAANAFVGATVMGTTTSLSWHDTTTVVNDPYFYFVESINTGGTSASSGSPTTGLRVPLPPGTPTGLSASDGSSSALTLLTWNAVPGATGYRLYRSPTDLIAGATEFALIGETTSHSDTGGVAGAVYWYFVRAILPGGDSAPGHFDTGYRAPAPPAVPGSISATLGTHADGVLVSWAATDDTLVYRIFRSDGDSPQAAELLGETSLTEWLDTTAVAGRTYRYHVRAANLAGESGASLAALGYGTASDPLDDGFENNDDLTLATSLAGGAIDAIAVDADPDWYAIDLAPGETRLDVSVVGDASDGVVVLSLHDDSGAPVASSLDSHGAKVISHTGAAGASYRILVERDDGAAVPYALMVTPLAPGESGLTADGILGTSSPPSLGDGWVDRHGAGQVISQRIRAGQSRRLFVDLVNRSAVSGTFLARSGGGSRLFSLDHYVFSAGRWQRITGALKRSGSLAMLAPFERVRYHSLVRAENGSPGRRATLFIPYLMQPVPDPTATDQAKWILTMPPQRR